MLSIVYFWDYFHDDLIICIHHIVIEMLKMMALIHTTGYSILGAAALSEIEQRSNWCIYL